MGNRAKTFWDAKRLLQVFPDVAVVVVQWTGRREVGRTCSLTSVGMAVGLQPKKESKKASEDMVTGCTSPGRIPQRVDLLFFLADGVRYLLTKFRYTGRTKYRTF